MTTKPLVKDSDIVIVMFGREHRRYVQKFPASLRVLIKPYQKYCLRRESLKAAAEGYRVLPVMDFERDGGFYIYGLRYEEIQPVHVSL